MRGKMSGLGRGFGRVWARAALVVVFILVLLASLASTTWARTQYKTLYRFPPGGRRGSFPRGGLVADREGILYGTTAAGGAHGVGTVFELEPDGHGGWKETVLHSFDGTDGGYPEAGLIFDAAGNLYGTTSYGGAHGGGTVFELAPDGQGGWHETVLHSFNFRDGRLPAAGLTFDFAGNLYGTTYSGGASGAGTVFELSPDGHGGWNETVLHSFNGRNGNEPVASVIFDAAGNLYGTTYYGGAHNGGTVFELAPNGHRDWKETVLHSFNEPSQVGSSAGLVFDTAGNLYGTTDLGGPRKYGTVFKLSPNGHSPWEETVLHSFKDQPGAYPNDLIFDTQGHLYGTTIGDEDTTFGSVFEITP